MSRHHSAGFAAAFALVVAGPLLFPALSFARSRSAGLAIGGGTTVSGVIGVNTTWSVAGSPFIVTGNLQVANGAQLTIEPGVEVRIDGNYLMRVDGELVGDAGGAAPIRFTSNAGMPIAGNWQYIMFSPTSVPAALDVNDNYVSGSILRNVEISFGRALVIRDAYPFLAELWIHDCRGQTDLGGDLLSFGVININLTDVESTEKVVVRDSTLQGHPESDGNGIVLSGNGTGSVLVRSNTFSGFAGPGLLFVAASASVRIVGNRFEYCEGMHISAVAVIEENRILNCLRGGDLTYVTAFRRNLIQNSGPVHFSSSTAEVVYNSFIGSEGPFASPALLISGNAGPTIQHNNFEGGDNPHDLYLTPVMRNDVDGRFNYWGTTDPMVIASRIYDENDHFVPGEVDFSGFLTAREQLAPVPLGKDTAGIYVQATASWFLRNDNSPGAADLVFGYGPAGVGWLPLRGDWDGNGTDTAGLYDPVNGNFFLKNSNAPGAADLVYGFGPGGLGWKPLVGDWNGDGIDTAGLYNPASSFFFLRNSHAPGAADLVYGFGPAGLGWTPMPGDWDGNGTDTVGLYDPATGNFFLRNSHAPGGADLVYGFGPAGIGWKPVSGDWNGDGADTIGLYSPSNGFFFLKNSHAPGTADVVFGYGPADTMPILGDWNGL